MDGFMEHPIKMDDNLGFPILGNIHMGQSLQPKLGRFLSLAKNYRSQWVHQHGRKKGLAVVICSI
jgi:hypothetical protein